MRVCIFSCLDSSKQVKEKKRLRVFCSGLGVQDHVYTALDYVGTVHRKLSARGRKGGKYISSTIIVITISVGNYFSLAMRKKRSRARKHIAYVLTSCVYKGNEPHEEGAVAMVLAPFFRENVR